MIARQGNSMRMGFLAIVLTAALAVATPEFARAQESNHIGFYFKLESRGNFSDGDEFPYAENNGNGRVLDIGLNSSFSGRVGAGARINSWDIGLLYSGLKASNSHGYAYQRSATFSAGYFPLVNPFGTAATYYSSVNASTEFTYNVVDFEVGYSFKLGQTDVRVFGGARYADITRKDQSAAGWYGSVATLYTCPGTYSCTPSTLYVSGAYIAVFKREADIWGIGPRLGIEAAMPVGAGGFRLTGSVSGAALFGDRNTTDSALGSLFGNPLPAVNRLNDDNSSFYNAEGELGVAYGVELGNASSMMITLGYRAEAWFGVTNTRNSAVSPTGRVFGDSEANELFHGPFLKALLNF